MSAIVIDASVAVKWLVAEELSEFATRLLGQELAAPALIEAEVTNVLWSKVRRGELSDSEAEACVATFQRAPVRILQMQQLLVPAFRLAVTLAHPVYDCLYLALAWQLNAVLVTADRRFAMAARNHPGSRGTIAWLGDARGGI